MNKSLISYILFASTISLLSLKILANSPADKKGNSYKESLEKTVSLLSDYKNKKISRKFLIDSVKYEDLDFLFKPSLDPIQNNLKEIGKGMVICKVLLRI